MNRCQLVEKAKMLPLAVLITLFSIGKSQPTPTPAIVAQDGSGSSQTITDAINAVPNYSKQKHYINIKKGVYHEHVTIRPEKTNIVLIGEGMGKTIISGKRSNASGFSLQDTATVGILGSGFMAQGISFENLAGPKGGQAVAVHASAESTFYQCRFIGYQDTLYARNAQQFYRDCEIIGTVDFIFGDSTAVFQNCIIRARQPLPNQYVTITAQGRKTNAEQTGFVFQNCTVNTEQLRKAKIPFRCYLGRPWKEFSRNIFMQSFIDLIDPEGWIAWNGKVPGHPFFAEYANRGPGANTLGRVNWSIIATRTDVSKFTVRNFLNGGTWIPPTVPRYLDLLKRTI